MFVCAADLFVHSDADSAAGLVAGLDRAATGLPATSSKNTQWLGPPGDGLYQDDGIELPALSVIHNAWLLRGLSACRWQVDEVGPVDANSAEED